MSSMRRGNDAYHHGDLREALVTAALAILSESGDPANLTLREAARRAGVSAMAPYRHFPDKEALIAAVAAVGFNRLAAAQAEADRHRDPVEALIGQGVAYVAFACADPALFRVMFGPATVVKTGDLANAAARSFGVLAARVVTLAAPASAEHLSLQCWAMAHGLAALAVDGQLADRSESPAVLADRMLRASFVPR